MKSHPAVRVCWYAVNVLLVISFGAVLYGVGWEFSTRSYLRGFSDAIVPYSDNPEQKVEAIVAWMEHGPARRSTPDPSSLSARNPEDTLNYKQLLEVCGTATNAFVNLAKSSGLRARRLLLLDDKRVAKHVVVEVLLNARWVVVDPSRHVIFRDPTGRFLTRAELQNPQMFRAATEAIPNYPSSYTYERTVHVRLGRIPLVGLYSRQALNFIWPSWEELIDWTLLLERESFVLLTISILLLFFALSARLFLDWYGSRRLGIARVRLRDQLVKVGEILFSRSQ
jgi:hypothetical protein